MIFTRGSMGTHLFELAYAIGKYSKKPNSLILNFHSIRDCLPHAKKTNIYKLISNFRLNTYDVPSRRKQGCFNQNDFPEAIENFFQLSDGGFTSSFSYYSNINELGHLRVPDTQHNGLDRDSVKIDHNLKKIQQKFNEHKVTDIVSNNPKFSTGRYGVSAHDDFKAMVSATKIVGTYSLFSLSTLLFKTSMTERKKIILILGKDLNKHIKNDFDQILRTRLNKHVSAVRI